MERKFFPGDKVQHFKRQYLTAEELSADPGRYLYDIIGTAEHTETGEVLMVYRPCYGERKLYARPLDMFLSPVDRKKYSDSVQEFRFEKI